MQKTYNKIKSSLSNGFDGLMKFKAVNLFYISIFIVVIVVFWGRLIALFKPSNDSNNQSSKVTEKNNEALAYKRIAPDGYFYNGLGQKTKYNITQARENAERLSALLNTYKGAKWYSVTLSFFGFGSVEKIKIILNSGYPSNYRRYVIDTYRDVYTDYRSLQTDVNSSLTGFAGSSWWDNNLTKYFTL